jgi:dipeptidyl-peptidase-4
LEITPYPKAGDPNPIVKLGIVNASGGATRWADTYKYLPSDLLITRVGWTPDSRKVIFHAQDREQKMLDLNLANATDGKTSTLFRETTKAWVEAKDNNPRYLKDGSFLWLSDRNGWQHLYHYANDGKLLRQVTDGKWEIRSVEGVDEAKGIVYFTGTVHSHIAPNAYRIKLDGTELTRLTAGEGSHRVDFNPTFTHFVDYWSDLNTPQQVRLFDANGKLSRVIAENKVAALGQYKLGKAELMQVKTRDGFTMEAMMIRPPDFDPTKKYPVMSFTYSGPQAPQVRNAWGSVDSIYTERYMGTPQNNPEGYRRSSPLHNAKDLHGKILLIHGTMDDNVHVQNTIQFAYELQKAGKPFQLMLYPKSRHGVTEPALVKHMRQMMTDFILTNL